MKNNKNNIPLATEIIKEQKGKIDLFKIFTIISSLIIIVLFIIYILK